MNHQGSYFPFFCLHPVGGGGGGGGGSGDAMVLGNLPVPGRPTNLGLSLARAC